MLLPIRGLMFGSLCSRPFPISSLASSDPSPYLEEIETVIPLELQRQIIELRLPVCSQLQDTWSWEGASDGCYNSRDAYAWLMNLGNTCTQQLPWSKLWRTKLLFFLWLLFHEALPVNGLRFHKHIAPSANCTRCQDLHESIIHIVRDCPEAYKIWCGMGHQNVPNFFSLPLHDWLQMFSGAAITFCCTLWWQWRLVTALHGRIPLVSHTG
ncbi:hypothetical protein L6164_033449 [Bauhinia variegata]|uniref:Uncharacterized protein n=1 Tax=Bauhinia variegata TaxID=167791 RepID=A0ACB9KS92_BAUVA|nr:hypothetical protein L6164_033449 [Bauhinia variegata]